MLKIYIIDDNGCEISSESPLSLSIDMSLSVPCDSATVVLPYKKLQNAAMIKIYDDKDLMFVGVVDEEINIFNSTGSYKKYVARSKMALLVDNQAYPNELTNITRTYLGNKYLQPFSIDYDKGEEAYSGKIVVDDGMTIYQLIEEYCKNVFSSVPRMTPQGKLLFCGGSCDNEISFDDQKGIKYTSMVENKKRCEKISKVSLMTNSKFYDYIITNNETVDTLICRERFLSASYDENIYPSTGEDLILKSNKDSYEVTVTCPYNLTHCLGYIGKIGEINEDLEVAEICYTYNSKGEETILTLKRRK